MVCRRCRASPGPWETGPARTIATRVGVVCAYCGAVMAPAALAERLVDKLAQLSRVGLTGPEMLRRATRSKRRLG